MVAEEEEIVAGDAVEPGCPIPPPVRRFDGGLTFFPRESGLATSLNFQVVQKFQEHDPGGHRQPVKAAIEALVLAHDVARGFQEGAERLGGGGLFNSVHHSGSLT